jgi:hypothetical protein
MTHRHVCNYSIMMGAISGVGKEEFEVIKGQNQGQYNISYIFGIEKN